MKKSVIILCGVLYLCTGCGNSVKSSRTEITETTEQVEKKPTFYEKLQVIFNDYATSLTKATSWDECVKLHDEFNEKLVAIEMEAESNNESLTNEENEIVHEWIQETSKLYVTLQNEFNPWTYNNDVDDLTGDLKAINAYCTSTNEIEFDSYGNTTKLSLNLIYSSNYLSKPSSALIVGLVGLNGSCRFSDFQGSGMRVVFDDNEVDDTWSLMSMTSSRKGLYIYWPRDVLPFIEKLKQSEKLKIQVNLQNVGMKTFEFKVAGLKWDFEN